MADSSERTIEDRLSEVDEVIDSPTIRFQRIMEALKRGGVKDPLDWDVVCFCCEYIGMMAATRFTWLVPAAKHLNWLVYNAHYLATKEMGLWPQSSIIKPPGVVGMTPRQNGTTKSGEPPTSNDGSKEEGRDSSPRRLM